MIATVGCKQYKIVSQPTIRGLRNPVHMYVLWPRKRAGPSSIATTTIAYSPNKQDSNSKLYNLDNFYVISQVKETRCTSDLSAESRAYRITKKWAGPDPC